MKRIRRSGKIDAWVWTIIAVMWGLFGLFALVSSGFGWFGFILWSCIEFVVGFTCSMCIKGEQDEEVLEFIMYYFERWNKKEQIYESHYYVDQKILCSQFVYNFYVKDFISQKSQEEVEKAIIHLQNDSYNTFKGFKTKQDAMLDIVETVKRLIEDKKAKENVKIRNVKSIETYTLGELEKRINDGEFKNTEK